MYVTCILVRLSADRYVWRLLLPLALAPVMVIVVGMLKIELSKPGIFRIVKVLAVTPAGAALKPIYILVRVAELKID